MADTIETTPEERQKRRHLFLASGKGLMRSKLRGKAFVIPSLITVLGIFCGFLAMLSAFKGRFEYAAVAIGLAFVFDGLDGRVARRLNATSAFGREFDSLSDVIAFGAAPAVLGYCWAFAELADEFGILVCFLFVVCGATRLARFNVSAIAEPSKKHFDGLPIPAAALGVVSTVYLHPAPISSMALVSMLAIYFLALAVLMVSTIPFLSIKTVRLTDGNPKLNLVLLSVVVALAWYHSRIAGFVFALSYAASGPVIWMIRRKNPDFLRKTKVAKPT